MIGLDLVKIQKRIRDKYILDGKCPHCGHKKTKGILGLYYCPNKHGTGEGPNIANQPQSIPK